MEVGRGRRKGLTRKGGVPAPMKNVNLKVKVKSEYLISINVPGQFLKMYSSHWITMIAKATRGK